MGEFKNGEQINLIEQTFHKEKRFSQVDIKFRDIYGNWIFGNQLPEFCLFTLLNIITQFGITI